MIRALDLLGEVHRAMSRSSSSGSDGLAHASTSRQTVGSPYFSPSRTPSTSMTTRSKADKRRRVVTPTSVPGKGEPVETPQPPRRRSKKRKEVEVVLPLTPAITPQGKTRRSGRRSKRGLSSTPPNTEGPFTPAGTASRDPNPKLIGSDTDEPPTKDESKVRRTRKRKIRTIVEVEVPTRKTAVTPALPTAPTSRSRRSARKARTAEAAGSSTAATVLAASEKGNVEPVGKIFLIQERVRHDPWKLLVATTLLNVTSGRAARPVFIEILRRYPTPQVLANADTQELIELLYPIGLFIQRANSLKTLSRQYLDWQWPIMPCHRHPDPHNPYEDPLPPLPLHVPLDLPEKLDVNIFRGAGRYASDSFRIYSHLLPGRGGPDREKRWLEKRQRAIERLRAARGNDRDRSSRSRKEDWGQEVDDGVEEVREGSEEVLGAEEVGGYLSEEEDVGEEEWRKVRPLDKELRRYLIWRWGLEGIVYDIHRGPLIKREADLKRLDWGQPDEST